MDKDTLDAESVDTDTQAEESQDGAKGSNWESRYKDIQRHDTKVSQKCKALEEQLGTAQSLITALQTQRVPEKANQNKPDWLSETKGVDLLDEPDKIIEVLKRFRSDERKQLSELLQLRDSAFDEKINTISPRTIQARELVETHREDIQRIKEDDPDMADVPDLAIAKLLAKQRGRDDDGAPMLPSIGGKRVASKGKASVDREMEAMMQKLYPKELGFNRD